MIRAFLVLSLLVVVFAAAATKDASTGLSRRLLSNETKAIDDSMFGNSRRNLRQCKDTSNGHCDSYGDCCHEYHSNKHWCGGYDTSNFKSNQMCCACGGGDNKNDVPCTATFIDNENGHHYNTRAFKVKNFWVFQVNQGGWFKLVSVDYNGKQTARRHSSTRMSPRNAVSVWDNAHTHGPTYKVKNVEFCREEVVGEVPCKAIFIDNENGHHYNIKSIEMRGLWVFQVWQGGWYKLVSVDYNGKQTARRHSNRRMTNSNAVAVWNDSHRHGPTYKVKNVEFCRR